jgi:hypothetical protein
VLSNLLSPADCYQQAHKRLQKSTSDLKALSIASTSTSSFQQHQRRRQREGGSTSTHKEDALNA